MIEILTNPRFVEAKIFEEDFDDIVTFFDDIFEKGDWAALPGGIIDTYIPSKEKYKPITLVPDDFRGYRMDTRRYIASDKEIIARALSSIEGRILNNEDFTLCPSVSFGLFVVFLVLKQRGIKTIISELPAYFASVEQASAIDLRLLLWPTLPEERYEISPADLIDIRKTIVGPVALLITQPRYGMGHCRTAESVIELTRTLRNDDVLIVDEAADQSVPAPLASIATEGGPALIRVRGLTKGLGLNSAKVAAIFHPSSMRSIFSEVIDFAGGALDAASLALVKQLCQEPTRYIELLMAARTYVRNQRAILERALLGLPIAISPLESGYIGTAHIAFCGQTPGSSISRHTFLSLCRSLKMPVVLGSSMYFPYTNDREIIRINYFTAEHNLRASATVLSKILDAMK